MTDKTIQSRFEKTVLSNGLTVITESVPGVRSVAIGVWVNVGSRDEFPQESGVSHFIEHMIFKGTERRSAFDIAKTFDRLGGFSNAFTSRETTCFHARVLDTHIDTISDLLADIVLNSRFDESEVERERQVILQEINMVEDTPDDYVHELFNSFIWGDNPLGRSILGSRDSVTAVTSDFLKSFVNKAYVAPRTLIAAAGNLSHDAFVESMERLFEKLPAADAQLPRRITPSLEGGARFYQRECEQVHMLMGFNGISASAEMRYAATLMNVILGGSMSSRLFQEVREKRGLAYSVYSFLTSYHDSGVMGMYAGTAPESVSTVASLMQHELERLAKEPVTRSELEDARDQVKGAILLASENMDSRMSRIAKNEINLHDQVSYEEIEQRFDEITPDDIMQVAGMCLNSPAALVTLGPVPDDEARRCEELLGK